MSDVGSPGELLLDVEALRIESRMAGKRHTIVRDIGLFVRAGECVGIVGESGSGKSLTARAIIGLLPDGVFASGAVRYDGKNLLDVPEKEMLTVRGSGISLLFQDPFTMLNPLMKVGEQITETVRTEGRRLDKRGRRAEAVRRLAEVEIRDPTVAGRYPFELSGGMRQRVGLAAALAGEPRLLIADEPSTALDVTTQKEVLKVLKSLQESRQMGLVLITHDLRVAFSVCDRVYVLYAGSLLEVAPSGALEREPLHPYSLGLLLCEPPVDLRVERLYTVEGSVPTPDDVRGQCPFSLRCRWVQEVCTTRDVQLRDIEPDRKSACLRAEEIRDEMVSVRRAFEGKPHVKSTPAQREPLLLVENLSKTFGGKRSGIVRALAGVSIEINPGESVGIVGESGSGKTTLGRCLVGLETADSGRIIIDGIDASNYRDVPDLDRRRLRRTIQIVFQDPYSSLNPVLTVGATLREVVEMGSHGGSGKNAAGVDELLERVGLPREYADRKPSSLSGGERQRVAIARALGMHPRIIVCDEPVSAVDVSVQAQIINVLKDVREELGIAYLFITHDLSVVRQVADRVYVLYQGEVVESGDVDATLDKPTHPYTIRLMESVPRSEGVERGDTVALS